MHHSELPGWNQWVLRLGTEELCAAEFERLRSRTPQPRQSLTAGTLLSGTRVPLKVWFVGVWIVWQWRLSTSRVVDRSYGYPFNLTVREFHRQIGEGVVDYRTAWRMFAILRKLVVKPRHPGGGWESNFTRYLMKPARETRLHRTERAFERLSPQEQEERWQHLPEPLQVRLLLKALGLLGK